MAGFTLEIIFAGLVALVPSQDNSKLTMLLVEAQQPTEIGGVHIPAHRPLMIYRCVDRPTGCESSLEQGDQAVDRLHKTWEISPFDDTSTEVGVLELNRVEIELGGALETGFRKIDHDRKTFPGGGAKHRIPDPEEARDISWIIDMNNIVSPAAAKINSSCLETSPPADLIVSRSTFTSGEVAVKRILFDGGAAYTFKLPGEQSDERRSCGQALADRTAISIAVKDCSPVTITLRSFDGFGSRKIDILPKDCGLNLNAKVAVFISNRMECSMWKSGAKIPDCLDAHAVNSKGEHFLLYRKISAAPPGVEGWPLPDRVLAPQGNGDGNDRPICPQPKFSAQ